MYPMFGTFDSIIVCRYDPIKSIVTKKKASQIDDNDSIPTSSDTAGGEDVLPLFSLHPSSHLLHCPINNISGTKSGGLGIRVGTVSFPFQKSRVQNL